MWLRLKTYISSYVNRKQASSSGDNPTQTGLICTAVGRGIQPFQRATQVAIVVTPSLVRCPIPKPLSAIIALINLPQ